MVRKFTTATYWLMSSSIYDEPIISLEKSVCHLLGFPLFSLYNLIIKILLPKTCLNCFGENIRSTYSVISCGMWHDRFSWHMATTPWHMKAIRCSFRIHVCHHDTPMQHIIRFSTPMVNKRFSGEPEAEEKTWYILKKIASQSKRKNVASIIHTVVLQTTYGPYFFFI